MCEGPGRLEAQVACGLCTGMPILSEEQGNAYFIVMPVPGSKLHILETQSHQLEFAV